MDGTFVLLAIAMPEPQQTLNDSRAVSLPQGGVRNGVGLAYAVANAFFGGLAEYVA